MLQDVLEACGLLKIPVATFLKQFSDKIYCKKK